MTLFCIASAMLPDIDAVGRFFGQEFYLLHHRELTHSLLVTPGLCWVFSLAFYRFSPIKNLRLLFQLSLLAAGIHLTLDLITSYGTTLFYPFTQKRYSADFVFIIDLTLTAILIIPVLLCRKWAGNPIRTARRGFLVLAVYIALCGASHAIAWHRTRGWARNSFPDILKISVLPKPPMLFFWGGIVETPDNYYQTFFNILSLQGPQWTAFAKRADSPLIQSSEKTDLVKRYRHFARFPTIFHREQGERHIVEYGDLRFQIGWGFTRMPFLLMLVYDDRGELISSGLRSGEP